MSAIERITKTNFLPSKSSMPAYAEKVNEIIDRINDVAPIAGSSVLYVDGILSANPLVYGFPIWNGIDPSDWIVWMDDFIGADATTISAGADSSLGYNIVSDGVGATGISDGLGGWLDIVTGGSDNNETYFASVGEAFLFDTDKKLAFKARIKLTEANDDDANWIIGLSDNGAANFLQDDGDGPAASYDGAVFFKVDGTMTIQFETSNAATQVTNAALATFVSGTTYNLTFVYDYNDGVTGYITPYVNGVAGTRHAITIAGLQEMHVVMGVKAGGGNAETFQVDYVAVAQERR